jgi:hypothetical protein
LDISEYEDEFLPRVGEQDPLEPMEPAGARKFVEGAVGYAARLGFSPHPDYKRACRV